MIFAEFYLDRLFLSIFHCLLCFIVAFNMSYHLKKINDPSFLFCLLRSLLSLVFYSFIVMCFNYEFLFTSLLCIIYMCDFVSFISLENSQPSHKIGHFLLFFLNFLPELIKCMLDLLIEYCHVPYFFFFFKLLSLALFNVLFSPSIGFFDWLSQNWLFTLGSLYSGPGDA